MYVKKNVISFISGDPDENVFIVQSGKVNVFVTNQEGLSISLKIVQTGDSLISLLSFADVLTVISTLRKNSLSLIYSLYK